VSSQQDLPVCLPFAWPPDACPSAAAGVTVAGSANVAASPQGVSDFHFMVVVVVVAVVLALVHPLPSRPASNFTARRTGCWVLYALRSTLSLSLSLSPLPCSYFLYFLLLLLFPLLVLGSSSSFLGFSSSSSSCSRSAGKSRARNDCSLYTEHYARSTTCFQPASCVEFFPKSNGNGESDRERESETERERA